MRKSIWLRFALQRRPKKLTPPPPMAVRRCERGVVRCLKERDGLKRHRDVLWNEHRTAHLCRVIGERSASLRAVYADDDGARQALSDHEVRRRPPPLAARA